MVHMPRVSINFTNFGNFGKKIVFFEKLAALKVQGSSLPCKI